MPEGLAGGRLVPAGPERSAMTYFHATQSPVATGLACRCPRCGRGSLFTGLLKVRERCSACGLDLAWADSADGPAVFVIFIVGALATALALLVEAWFAPPYWLHMVLWPPIILGGSLLLLRPAKGILIALQYRHKSGEARRDNGRDDSAGSEFR
ncbi:MAG: DUF983 domain-containing protein [Rhodospirillaceae bacterium]|nr:DUF983 domain-containing protein [Rhodospirillaceae bacterium]